MKDNIGVGIAKAGKNWITFKSQARAEKYLSQLKSVHSKYSSTSYYRKGKTVFRY